MLPPFSLPCPRAGEIDRLTSQSQACQPGGDAPRWGSLSAARKEPKTTQGGASPRLVEPTPRCWTEGAPFSFRPLAWWGHIEGVEILQNVPTPLTNTTSIARALLW